METAIRERIKEFLRNSGVTINSLSKGSSQIQRKLNRQISEGSTITSDVLVLLSSTFPDLSSEWLLRGEGEMLRQTATEAEETGHPDAALLTILREKDATIERLNREIGRLEERITMMRKAGPGKELTLHPSPNSTEEELNNIHWEEVR